MAINDFTKALHEDEKELAREYQDEHGTDWNAYILAKEKAGFCKFDEWYFMNFNHLTIQLKSKYKTKWGSSHRSETQRKKSGRSIVCRWYPIS